jgi:hypothetical protein
MARCPHLFGDGSGVLVDRLCRQSGDWNARHEERQKASDNKPFDAVSTPT